MGIAIRMGEARRAVVVDGARTPFAAVGGPLRHLPAAELARLVITELVARTDCDPSGVAEVVLGGDLSPHRASDLAHLVCRSAGLHGEVSVLSVGRDAATGLESVAQASCRISLGMAEAVIACGADSMSERSPVLAPTLAAALRASGEARAWARNLMSYMKLRPRDLTSRRGLPEGALAALGGVAEGRAAEWLARRLGLSRQEQDALALRSHQRAAGARGRLAAELCPVYVSPDYEKTLTEDEGPRESLSLDDLSRLEPGFAWRHGTVTAGNLAPHADGACALLVMEEQRARAEGHRPLGRVRSVAFGGSEDGDGVSAAMARAALERAGVRLRDVDLVEIDEISAAHVLAAGRALTAADAAVSGGAGGRPAASFDPARVNVNGGAIAIGRPEGAGGVRILLTLLKEMRRRQAALGLATVAAPQGQGAAVVVEAV